MSDTFTPMNQNGGHDLASIVGQLQVTIGNFVDGVKKDADERRRIQAMALRSTVPSMVRFHATGTVPASGFLVLTFDQRGPMDGFWWNIRRLSIGGTAPNVTVAGRADVFVTAMSLGQITSFDQIGMADWVDQASPLPLVGSYSEGELMLIARERLFIVVSGGTTGQVVVANGVAQQVQDAAYRTSVDV